MQDETRPRRNEALEAWTRAVRMVSPFSTDSTLTLPALVSSLGESLRDAVALVFNDERVSYRDLAARINAYSLWALRQGVVHGDVVCLLMPNCPEYLAIWLGIVQAGGIVALVNTNLVSDPLRHSIEMVKPKHIIVSAELAKDAAPALSLVGSSARIWIHGDNETPYDSLRTDVEADHATGSEGANRPLLRLKDRALYIYTSGTTGMPKAAVVSHLRLMQWTHWFAGMMDIRPSDRMYNCLPMYHSVGGVVATGATLIKGGSVVLRPRFSATAFWDDVAESECTLFQYIGELCRYLVNSPSHPRETDHRLRLCCGNGLRPDVWDKFKQRFRIPRILEFYSSTEGTFSLYNCEGKTGAIGRIPPFLAHRFPVTLIRVDIATGVPIRGEDGFCIRCATGEVGEALGGIVSTETRNGFEGYSDATASERKVLRNVFAAGDAWYRSGDLMSKDAQGFFYFVDRLGDTFRWKGENVSTVEVAEILATCPGIIEAVVYGVSIPGTEGRAGMAAAVVSQAFDLGTFRQHLVTQLPKYARPLFLRLCSAIETTATFKAKKHELAQEAYDPDRTADPIYFDDADQRAFVKLDKVRYLRLCQGDVRL